MKAGCLQACDTLTVDSFMSVSAVDVLDVQALLTTPLDLVHLQVTVPRLDVVGLDDAGHELQPVGQQVAATHGLAEDELAVAEATSRGAQVDLEEFDVAVSVVHVLHTYQAVQPEGLDDVADVVHDLVVRADDLRVGADLLTNHPLEELAVDAQCVDAQLGTGQHLHDKEAFHALLFFEPADFVREHLGRDLAGLRVSQQFGIGGDLPETTAVDSTRRFDANPLAVGETSLDLFHGPVNTDCLDAFGLEHAVPHPAGAADLVVDHLEGLVLADGVHRGRSDVREIVHRRRKRPEGLELVLFDELVERSGCLGLVVELRQVDHVETELDRREMRCSRQDDPDAGTLCRVGQCGHAVGETEQNTRL